MIAVGIAGPQLLAATAGSRSQWALPDLNCEKECQDNMPDRLPEHMSDRMPEKKSDRVPENMSDRMPEYVSDKM